MHIIYRISDNGYIKNKPNYINNQNCLANASKVFNDCEWLVIADSVSEQTKNMINEHQKNINYVNIGHGAGTFRLAMDIALGYGDEEIVYFLENDYLHKNNSSSIIKDAFSTKANCEYVTLYDHLDKYIPAKNGGNPYIEDDHSEYTRIYLGNLSHYKLVYSTTMTFATKVKYLKEDYNIFQEFTKTNHPYDFYIFTILTKKLNRKMLCPIPGYSTHGEVEWLAPLIDWSKI